MSLLTIIVNPTGTREIILQDAARATHQALYTALLTSAPTGVQRVEIWDSNGGVYRGRDIVSSKGAPSLEQVREDCEAARASDARKVKAAIAADAKAAAKGLPAAEAPKEETPKETAPPKK